MRVLYLFICISCFFPVSGQGDSVIVFGQVYNASITRRIEVVSNLRYYNGILEKHIGVIDENGTFEIRAHVPHPMIVALDYYGNRDYLYVQPGDSVKVEFIAQEFPASVVYSKDGTQTAILKRFRAEMGIETNPFKLIQYRYGNQWFVVNAEINRQMQLLKPDAFTHFMAERLSTARQYIEAYTGSYTRVSPAFKSYLEAEAYYEWAYYQLMYGLVYDDRHKVQSDYFAFLDSVSVVNPHIGSYNYQKFLDQYVNYQAHLQAEGTVSDHQLFEAAAQFLVETPRAYVQSEILRKSIVQKRVKSVEHIYRDFLEKNPVIVFSNKVVETLKAHQPRSYGAKAPDFAGMDIDGQVFRLTDTHGQPVLLYFWATWCKPCLQKMKYLTELMPVDFADQDVRFVFVSLDDSELVWKSTIQLNDFAGTHLRVGGDTSEGIAELYKVQTLPTYFILDKKGTFAETPGAGRFHEVSWYLQKLNQ